MLEPRSLVLRTSLELRWTAPELEAATEPRDLRPAPRPRIICQRCVHPEQHEDSSVAPLNMLTPSLVLASARLLRIAFDAEIAPVVPVATELYHDIADGVVALPKSSALYQVWA